MSWMLHSAGSKIGVKQKVEVDPHLPAEVKSAIQAIVDKMPVNRGVVVETPAPARQRIVSLYVPEKGKKTELLSGSAADAAKALVQKLRDQRVID